MIFHKVQTSANVLTGSSCFNNHLHIPMHMNSQSYQILTLLYLPSLLLVYIAICVSFTFCIKFYTHTKENRGSNRQSIPCDHVVFPILIFTAIELMSQDTLHTSGSTWLNTVWWGWQRFCGHVPDPILPSVHNGFWPNKTNPLLALVPVHQSRWWLHFLWRNTISKLPLWIVWSEQSGRRLCPVLRLCRTQVCLGSRLDLPCTWVWDS